MPNVKIDPNDIAIRLKGLKKSFDKPVLDDLNLDIEDGTIFGLVGINGAGKSTLLKIMAGIMKPEEARTLIWLYQSMR